jgi:hypothetical protein
MISLHDNARNPAKATREHKKTLWEKAVAECFLGGNFYDLCLSSQQWKIIVLSFSAYANTDKE